MLKPETITKDKPFKICFVCLGNICRSPTAEGIFQRIIREGGLDEYFEIDSAGTSAWHIGEPANSKSRMIAGRYGTPLLSRARKFEPVDLNYYDLIVAMDFENREALKTLDRSGDHTTKITTLRKFDPEPGDGQVPDPFFGGINGFENVYEIIWRSCDNLVDQLRQFVNNKA
ncbi:MAG: low molecular weight protein-tyrosine-phosphatase [Balneolales bacterium]